MHGWGVGVAPWRAERLAPAGHLSAPAPPNAHQTTTICMSCHAQVLRSLRHRLIGQAKHRDATQSRLHEFHRHIVSTMKTTYEVFKTDGPEVSSLGNLIMLH